MSGKQYLFLLIVTGFVSIQTANAGLIAEQEFAYLPKYCYSRLHKGADWDYWNSVFGDTWNHMHHYCIALSSIRKADRAFRNPRARKFLLQRAENNINYVLERAPANFVLYPELDLKMGKVLERLGRGSEAARFYLDAIQRKPDYSPPYAALSDYHKELGNMEEAKKILRQGLKHNPSSRSLKRRAKELGL